MRPALLVSLVLLYLFVEAQGIRLEKGLMFVGHQRIHEEKKNRLIEVGANGDGGGEVVICRDGHCSGSDIRKCLTKATSTVTTTSKLQSRMNRVDPMSKRIDQSKDNLYNKSLRSIGRPGDVGSKLYPDIIDIVGMDYSTTKRKTPIHN